MFKHYIENLNSKHAHKFNLPQGGNINVRVMSINLFHTFNFLLACVCTLIMKILDIKFKLCF